jgi:hypothetical protein
MVLSVVAVVFVIWIIMPLDAFHDCIQKRKYYQRYHALREHSFLIVQEQVRLRLNVVCAVHLINTFQTVIVALSTVAVAGFTATLWLVTRRSVRAAELSARTAESALLDLERGYLYIVDFRSDIGSFFDPNRVRMSDARPRIDVAAINHGRTPCTIVEASIALSFLPGEPDVQMGTDLGVAGVAQRNTFVVGPTKLHQFPSLFAGGAEGVSQAELIDGETGLYCYGWIRYVDIFDRRHPIVFCRRYNVDSDTWERVGGTRMNYTG